MRTYYISMFTEEGWANVGKVGGYEAAYNAFHKACELCEITWTICCLVDGETGEVIADNREEEEEETEEYEIDDLDLCNCNPYTGEIVADEYEEEV